MGTKKTAPRQLDLASRHMLSPHYLAHSSFDLALTENLPNQEKGSNYIALGFFTWVLAGLTLEVVSD